METTRRQNLENGLFALAFGLAVAVRLLRLGEIPLSDDEARWAMQAFDLTKGLRPEIGAQPAYVLLTALTFYILQASNFAARLIPALAGSALVFTPLFFLDRLGNKAMLVLSFALALEPGLLALSRLAGSPILAITAVMFAWGLWRTGKIRAAGVLAGVALLSGPALWPGLIGLGAAYAFIRGFASAEANAEAAPELASDQPQATPLRQNLLLAGAFALGTYLALGSFFLLAPGGLSGGMLSIPGYFGQWLDFTDVPGSRLLAALVLYQPLALILASAALIRGLPQRDRSTSALAFWLVLALVLALANPSRQVADLAWALIPLWALAALEISRHLNPIQDGVWETLGMTGLTLGFLFFAGLNFYSIALVDTDPVRIQLHWGVLFGALVLLGLSIALVAFGWSKETSLQGSLWGALIVGVLYTLAVAMAAGGLRTYRTVEMWPTGTQTAQADALLGQMKDTARWKTGVDQALDVTAAGLDSPALRWLLRDWHVTFSDVTLSGNPSLAIVSDQLSSPDLESAYRGQAFFWRAYPSWNQLGLSDWLRWIALHELPQGQENIILWTRNDIFVNSAQPNNTP
jgi:hypothetical protein